MRIRLFVWLTLVATPLFAPLMPHALHCLRSVWMDIRTVSVRVREVSVRENGVDAGEGLKQAPAQERASQMHEAHAEAEAEQEKLVEAVANVPEAAFRDALESSLKEQGTQGAEFRELLTRRWAETDPKAAAAWAVALQDPASAVSLTKQAAIVWANKDMPAAVEWANGLRAGVAREAAVIAVGYEAARTESFEAFDLAASLSPSSERDALLAHLARQWAANDFREAVDWARQVLDEALR